MHYLKRVGFLMHEQEPVFLRIRTVAPHKQMTSPVKHLKTDPSRGKPSSQSPRTLCAFSNLSAEGFGRRIDSFAWRVFLRVTRESQAASQQHLHDLSLEDASVACHLE